VTSTRDIRRVAAERFGWARLREEQVEAMEHVLAGHDVLADPHLGVERFTEDGDKRAAVVARVRGLTADPATEGGLVPDSPDSYHQQVGRAGRDGEPAEISTTRRTRPTDLLAQAGVLTVATTPTPEMTPERAVEAAVATEESRQRLRPLSLDAVRENKPHDRLRGRNPCGVEATR
jgi:hypothetical protein